MLSLSVNLSARAWLPPGNLHHSRPLANAYFPGSLWRRLASTPAPPQRAGRRPGAGKPGGAPRAVQTASPDLGEGAEQAKPARGAYSAKELKVRASLPTGPPGCTLGC